MQILVKSNKNTVIRLRFRCPFCIAVTSFGFFTLPKNFTDTGHNTAVQIRKSMHLNLNRFIVPILITLCYLLIFLSACETKKHYVSPAYDIKNIRKVAIFPFENFTSDEYAGEKVRRILITELLSNEIDVVEPGEINRLLREFKVKSISSIKVAEAQEIGKILGADAIMIGVVENYDVSKGISVTYPEVTIILRLIETSSGSVIWAIRQTSGGPDFWMRHFGSEGPSLSETAGTVVKEAIGTLF